MGTQKWLSLGFPCRCHKQQKYNSDRLAQQRVFGAHNQKVQKYGRGQRLHRVTGTHSPSALLTLWCGPWQLPAHTVPHILSPSLVSNTNQRTLIRGWVIHAGQTKTARAHHGTPVWKCTAWAWDEMTKTLALEMFMFESVVIVLRLDFTGRDG